MLNLVGSVYNKKKFIFGKNHLDRVSKLTSNYSKIHIN